MCLLKCNLCGGITAVVLSRCRSLYSTLCGSLWTPAYSVVSICVYWPPKRRVYNITPSSLLRGKYLLLLCHLLEVSQYRLALIDTASVHIVKGISQHIHNISSSQTTTQRGGRSTSIKGETRTPCWRWEMCLRKELAYPHLALY